ncbi:TlyA family RNA methyltransferase [Oricola thermophila]|uniref:TlyA family RNA methyltransferase n=1 Tax=Oricola thermophila TaxID=2742145 RepID=A0A6N1VCW6_9HYPH|nr:TlyA family RNA methyltransferase [Oricola thermophila]QKV18901.1 TlyA family RNA methyltransferase [Oricola thermophila]
MSTVTSTDRVRLDQLLVETGAFASRSRARDAILRGTVRVGGARAEKPGQMVPRDAEIDLDDPARAYVSRAALKLKAALGHFDLSPEGRIALDVGASTGGFTQVLLEQGAAHVFAVDVGHGQMAERLAADRRVTNIEGLNARDLAPALLGDARPRFVVSDVSFISLKLALPPALALAAPGAEAVLLVKPQFEVGRERIGKGGLVAQADAERCAGDLADWFAGQPGWSVLGLCPSPIAGGDGNTEYLLAGRKA